MGAEPHAGKPAGRQEAEPGKLRAGSIGVPSAMVMSIAIMAPAAGMIFLPQVVASHAGAAVPLVYLMSLIACLFIAGTITQFARLVPHAGSFYAYDAVGLGRTTGFVSGWLLMAGYFVFYPQNLLAAAYFTSSTLREELGWNVNWSVWAVLFAIAIWLLSTRGIRTSMRTDLTVVGAESLGAAIASLVQVLNPQAVVLGGGVMSPENAAWLIPAIQAKMNRHLFEVQRGAVQVLRGELGDVAGLWGALQLVAPLTRDVLPTGMLG